MDSALKKRFSYKVLDKFSEIDNSFKSISNQVENVHNKLFDLNGDDSINKELCLECAKKFKTIIEEFEALLPYIDNKLNNPRAWNFLTSDNIYINKYLGGIQEETINDIVGCWSLLNEYVNGKDRASNNNLNKPSWGGDYGENDYSLSMSNCEFNDVIFKDLISENKIAGVNSLYALLSGLNNTIDYKYFKNSHGNNKKEGEFIKSDPKRNGNEYTISYKTRYKYQSVTAYDKDGNPTEVKIIPTTLKKLNGGNNQSGYLYTPFGNVYYEIKFGSFDFTDVENSGFSSENYNIKYNITVTIYPSSAVNDDNFENVFKKIEDDSYKSVLKEKITNLINIVSSQEEPIDSSDYPTNPVINYKSFLNAIEVKDIKTITPLLFNYINKRKELLETYINGSENDIQMLYNDVLKSRLNKSSGSLIDWYRSACTVDNTIINNANLIKESRLLVSKLAVWQLEEDANENVVIVQKEPNKYYPLIIGYMPTLKVGDIVCLVDDNNAMTKTKVKSLTSAEKDGDVTLDGDGVITTKVDAFVVELEHNINQVYSSSYNFRLIKELS